MFRDNSMTVMKNNQITIKNNNLRYFYSYDSAVCSYDYSSGILYLNGDIWDYSSTTRKYFKEFVESYTNIEYKTKANFIKVKSSSEKIICIA